MRAHAEELYRRSGDRVDGNRRAGSPGRDASPIHPDDERGTRAGQAPQPLRVRSGEPGDSELAPTDRGSVDEIEIVQARPLQSTNRRRAAALDQSGQADDDRHGDREGDQRRAGSRDVGPNRGASRLETSGELLRRERGTLHAGRQRARELAITAR